MGGLIEDYSFFSCANLTNVTLGTSVTGIGAYAFSGFNQSEYNYSGDPLCSLAIPNSVINIASNAFYTCASLTNVTIGTNVTSIGDYAFCDTSLMNVTIPNSVTSIGDYAFYECGSLTSATIQGGTIGDYAFFGCPSLTNVTLGTNVASIGDYAFSSFDYDGDRYAA